jgi:hypothetical protein
MVLIILGLLKRAGDASCAPVARFRTFEPYPLPPPAIPGTSPGALMRRWRHRACNGEISNDHRKQDDEAGGGENLPPAWKVIAHASRLADPVTSGNPDVTADARAMRSSTSGRGCWPG